MAIGAIACGAVYVVLSPEPTIKRTASAPPSRLLPYERQITTPQPTSADGSASQQKEISPVEPLPVETAPVETAPAETAAPEPDAQGAGAAEQSAPDADAPTADDPDSSDVTALPPTEDTDASNPMAGPPQDRPGPPDQMAAWPREGADPSQPMAPGEGADAADPNAPPPGEPGEGPEQWVQVLVSGAGMYASASDDASMLFAFPYGRNLRVVSRYQDWVEVADPQSAATGWMKAEYLAPVAAAPGPPGEVDAGYEAEQPRGWFRRRPGGLADVISRALGGR
jgi:hypothetical protein